MNWIIRKSNKLSAHTYLGEILKPLDEYIELYNWIITDIDGGENLSELPIDYEHDYFVLSATDFRKILNGRFQFYWGIILAVPKFIDIKLDQDNLPYSEGNDMIWENSHIQYQEAEIEIACVDSSYTIVKLTKKELSDKFKTYFDEAITLDKFNSKKSSESK